METKTESKKSFGEFISDRNNISRWLPFAVLIVFTIVLTIGTKGLLIRPGNLASMANGIFAMMIMSMGGIFVYSSGGMDFSMGALTGLCMLELISITKSGLTASNITVAILACVGTCLLVGFINGFVAVKLKIPAIICTMATQNGMRGIIQTATSQGEISAVMGMSALDNLYVKIAVMVVIVVAGYIVFEKTRYGKQLRAIGGNPEAARQAGINVDVVRISSYMVLALCVAIAAIIVTPRQSVIRPSSGTGFELNVLIAMLLGGVPLMGGSNARAISAILGCVIVTVMENGLLLWGVSADITTCIKGVIFIIMAFVTTERSSRKIVM